MPRATAADVMDDPKLLAEIARINREHDEWEYRYRSERGMVIPKTLWRRLKKHRGHT